MGSTINSIMRQAQAIAKVQAKASAQAKAVAEQKLTTFVKGKEKVAQHHHLPKKQNPAQGGHGKSAPKKGDKPAFKKGTRFQKDKPAFKKPAATTNSKFHKPEKANYVKTGAMVIIAGKNDSIVMQPFHEVRFITKGKRPAHQRKRLSASAKVLAKERMIETQKAFEAEQKKRKEAKRKAALAAVKKREQQRKNLENEVSMMMRSICSIKPAVEFGGNNAKETLKVLAENGFRVKSRDCNSKQEIPVPAEELQKLQQVASS